MARPKMKFAPGVAADLIHDLRSKIKDYEFCESVLVKEADTDYPAAYEARKSLALLYELADKAHPWKPDFEPFPEEGCERLKQWLEAYVTPQGWQRILAAKRQRKASQKKHHGSYENRETTVAMQAHPSYELGALAKELGLDKKELLSRLPSWFLWDEKGKLAFEAFGTTVRLEQMAQGLKLLEEVFLLTTHQVKRVVLEAVDRDLAREQELLRLACFAGKPRLIRLTKALKAVPAQEQLTALVIVKHKDKLLLELAATGEMDAVLEALGTSSTEELTEKKVVSFN